MNRSPRTVLDRMVITAAALYVALCAGAVMVGTSAPATAGAAMPVQTSGSFPHGGPLPPLPPPPPEPPKAPAPPAPPPPPQSPAPQPRPSLANLTAAALPGLAGLAALSGLGGYVGYRQAKAGFVLRAAGTARFLS